VRVYTALFQLAKVERGRGRHAIAADLFRSVVARDPNGSLAEDARAEAAVSWFSAGQHDQARAAARESLEKHPSGTHASRMQRLLDRMPAR
jgi:tetratricopeptide (TPR) repeat protein